jgi:hypothetical protein
VKSIGQKYGSNRALGNFDRSPEDNPQPKTANNPTKDKEGGYPQQIVYLC